MKPAPHKKVRKSRPTGVTPGIQVGLTSESESM